MDDKQDKYSRSYDLMELLSDQRICHQHHKEAGHGYVDYDPYFLFQADRPLLTFCLLISQPCKPFINGASHAVLVVLAVVSAYRKPFAYRTVRAGG